ncbi:MAG TPA: hypothetical protein DCS93_32125 [Microscillaceae bacterium]|nr:hypothetical protein [Microscillaceae bacterium]
MDKEKQSGYALIGLGGAAMFLGITFTGLVPVIGGAVVAFLGVRKLMRPSRSLPAANQRGQIPSFEMDDSMILRLAKRKGGKLTVAELARQTSLTNEQAKARLEQFHLKGKTELHVTDDGIIVYEFIEE